MKQFYKEKCVTNKDIEFDKFALELIDLMQKYGVEYISHNWVSDNPFRISIYQDNSIEFRSAIVRFK